MGRNSTLKSSGYEQGTALFNEKHEKLLKIEKTIQHIVLRNNMTVAKYNKLVALLGEIDNDGIKYDIGKVDSSQFLKLLILSKDCLNNPITLNALELACGESNPKEYGWDNIDLTKDINSLINQQKKW